MVVRVPAPFPVALFHRVRYVCAQVIIYNFTHTHTHTLFSSAASQVVNMPYTGITVFTIFEQRSFRATWFDPGRFCSISWGNHVFLRKYDRGKAACAYVRIYAFSRLLRKYTCYASQTPFVMTRRQITYRFPTYGKIHRLQRSRLHRYATAVMHSFFRLQHHSRNLSCDKIHLSARETCASF